MVPVVVGEGKCYLCLAVQGKVAASGSIYIDGRHEDTATDDVARRLVGEALGKDGE